MGGVRGGMILYCTPPNLPIWGGTLENKVHQKTVFVQFGLASFRPIKIGKSWIASGFRPRNDGKYFLPKRTIKYSDSNLGSHPPRPKEYKKRPTYVGLFYILGRKDSNLRNAWTKTRCLTAWRRPITLLFYNMI